MRKMKSIKIVHNIKNRIEFLFMAEFFRLCGIYVGEYIYYNQDQIKKMQCIEDKQPCVKEIEYACDLEDECDVELYVGLDLDESSDIFHEDVIYLKNSWNKEATGDSYEHFTQMDEQQQEDVLMRVLDEVQKVLDAKRIFFDRVALGEIGHLYVKYHLVKYLADIQYFRIYCKKHAKSLEVFSAVEQELEEMCAASEFNIYYSYAKIYCATKANSASVYNRTTVRYDVEKLADACKEMIEKVPDFSNFWVLLGLVYEHLPEYSHEAISAFEISSKMEDLYRYAYHIYYWMAKRYEVYESRLEYAKKIYLKANEHKERFRNFYKLAMISFKTKIYDEAIAYFNKILEQLEFKQSENYLDPLEIDYYYKANSMISYIYCFCTIDPIQAIEYADRALEIVEDVQNNKYFDDFYMEEAEIYRRVTGKKINLNKIYQYLSISYRKLGMIEEADCWRKKIKTEQK